MKTRATMFIKHLPLRNTYYVRLITLSHLTLTVMWRKDPIYRFTVEETEA